MKKGLVNILTPVYNGECLVRRLLDSVLLQTYPCISMIVINDGSTDNTEEVIRSYIQKFEQRGYTLEIHNQPNGGQANAINNGLKLVDGEYLVWPDADDWYASPEAIEKLVNRLTQFDDDVAVSRCAYNRVRETDMKTIRVDYPCMGWMPENIFEKMVLFEPHCWHEPGGWMIKTKFLDELIPGREIYQSRLTGQNAQILWPYLFVKKCVSIEEPLFTYMIRESSHSRGMMETFKKKLQQQEEYYNTCKAVLNTIIGLNGKKREELSAKIRMRICKACIDICLKYGNHRVLRAYHEELRKMSKEYNLPTKLGYKTEVKIALTRIPFLNGVVRNCGKSKVRTIFTCIFVVSLFVNAAVIFICFSPRVARKYYNEISFKPIGTPIDAKELEKTMLAATNEMLNDDVATDESIMYYATIGEYLHHIFYGNELYSVFQYGEFGYFLHYAFLYGRNTNNTALMDNIKKRIDNHLLGDKFKIERNDQIAFGCILIDLHKRYGESRYRQLADKMLHRLDSIDKADGIVKYRGGYDARSQYVDGIGLICPFLNMYAQAYKSDLATEISARMLNDYASHGMDLGTGLPSQGYDIKSKVKIQSANWGRGCGWLCLGLADADSTTISRKNAFTVSRMDSTLATMAPLYSQYLGQEGSPPDMSATTFILYYLAHKGKINMTKEQFANAISSFVDRDGFLRYNSPTIARPDERPNAFQKHHVAQALALYMLSELK